MQVMQEVGMKIIPFLRLNDILIESILNYKIPIIILIKIMHSVRAENANINQPLFYSEKIVAISTNDSTKRKLI